MKLSTIILVFFLGISLFPQTPQDLITVSVSEREESEFQIQNLLQTIEKSYNEKKDFISSKTLKTNEKGNSIDINLNNNFQELVFLKIRLKEIDFSTSTSAQATVIFDIYKDGLLNKIKGSIRFKRERKHWYFIESDLTDEIVKNIQIGKKKHQNSTIASEVSIIVNNKTLLPMKFISDPDIWEINKNLLMDNFDGNQFFSESSEIDGNIYFYGNSYENKVLLFVDPVWARIVYVNFEYNEVKSYGDNPGDFEFKSPVSVAVGENGNLYIVDRGYNKIIRLTYNNSQNQINYGGQISISGLGTPSDIDYIKGTPQSLWIVDIENQKLLQVDLSGNIIHTVTGSKFEGVYSDFSFVERIATDRYGGEICVIDNGQKKVIKGTVSGSNNYISASNVVEFSEESYLTDVGMSVRHEYLVSDIGLNKVHRINEYGEYVCSFSSSSPNFGGFNFPFRVSSYSDNLDPQNTVLLSQNISSKWTSNSGIRRFLPNADVFNISHSKVGINPVYHLIGFSFTSFAKAKLELIIDNQVIWTQPEVGFSSGYHNEVFTESFLGNGDFTFRITYRTYHDEAYSPEYQQGWKVKNITFSVNYEAPPILSYFTQTPNPICSGSYGYVYSHLSQGTEPVSYNWQAITLPMGASITQMGSKCKIAYSAPLSSKESDKIQAPVIEIRCTASNSVGSSTKSAYPTFSSSCSPSGCPTLAFDNGGERTDENTLLISSLSNPDEDATDYYLINSNNKIQNGNIDFYIHEPEEEHTWFDEIELWELKANHGEFIAVTDEGEFINFRETKRPYKYTLNESVDVTAELEANDGNTYYFLPGDLLRVEKLKGKESPGVQSSEETFVTVIGVKPPHSDKIIAGDIFLNKQFDKASKTSSDTYGIGGFYLRDNMSTVSKKIGELNENDAVEIVFNNETEIDYFVLTNNLKTVKAKKLELISSEKGNETISNAISSKDGNYAELLPAEEMRFKYESKKNINKKEKVKHVLKVVGRYQKSEGEGLIAGKGSGNTITTGEEELPKENRLFSNYPNPFNPSTIIKYELKEPIHISLKVFDSLGRLVKVLQESTQSPGRYEVEFDGSDLSSGMYFYRLTSDNFNFTKKMLLIK